MISYNAAMTTSKKPKVDSKKSEPTETIELAQAEDVAQLLRGSAVTGEGRTALLSLWRKRQRVLQQPAVIVDCVGDAFPDEATISFAPGSDTLPLNMFTAAEGPEQQQQLATQLLRLADYQRDSLQASPELLILQQLLAEHWLATAAVTSLTDIVQTLASDENLMIGALPINAILAADQRQQMAMRLNALLIDGSIEKWGDGPLLTDAILNHNQTVYISLSTLNHHEQNHLLRCLTPQLQAAGSVTVFNLLSSQQLENISIRTDGKFTGLIGVVSLAREKPSDNSESVENHPSRIGHFDIISTSLHPAESNATGKIFKLNGKATTLFYPMEVPSVAAIDSLTDLKGRSASAEDSENWVDIGYFPVANSEQIQELHYRPGLLVEATFTYLLPRLGKKLHKTEVLLAMLTPSGLQVDEQSTVQCSEGWPAELQRSPSKNATPMLTPALVGRHDRMARSQKRMITSFARQQKIPLYHCSELGITSEPDETSEDFESRLRQLSAARNEDRCSAIQAKFEPKLRHTDLRIRKADNEYQKALKKIEGGNILLRPAKYLTSKALSSPLNPGMHLPLRRASSKNKLQGELTQCEQRLERLKRQKRELDNQYQNALDKQQRQHKNEELEYRRFYMKANASGVEIQRCLLCACPWGTRENAKGELKPYPVYSI